MFSIPGTGSCRDYCKKPVRRFYLILREIWCDEWMPEDWNLSRSYKIYDKRNNNVCPNYRGISFFFILLIKPQRQIWH